MRVLFQKSFNKKHGKLPKRIRDQFEERLRLFITNPFHALLNNHSVDARFPGCRSINVTGDFRAIFKEVEGGIIFITIGTHPELYG